MRFSVRLLVGVAALAVAVPVGAVAAAQPSVQPHADQQSSLVEDFSYPGAVAIQASDGVVLISGDGNIVYSACDTPPVDSIGVIQVHTIDGIGPEPGGTVCFKVLAAPAQISVMIPAVFEIRGDGQALGTGHKATADLTTDDGTKSTVTVDPSGSTPVGIGAGPGAAPTTLLAINVTA
jgi:hypothetical protein